MTFKQIYLTIDGSQTDTTLRPGVMTMKWYLHTPQISRSGTPPSDTV